MSAMLGHDVVFVNWPLRRPDAARAVHAGTHDKADNFCPRVNVYGVSPAKTWVIW